jgi:hypothetical protein
MSLLASDVSEDASRPIAFVDRQFSLEQYTYIVLHHEGIHQGDGPSMQP